MSTILFKVSLSLVRNRVLQLIGDCKGKQSIELVIPYTKTRKNIYEKPTPSV